MTTVKIHLANKEAILKALKESGADLPENVEAMSRSELIKFGKDLVPDIDTGEPAPEPEPTPTPKPAPEPEPKEDALDKLQSKGFKNKDEVESYLRAVDREKGLHKKRLEELQLQEEEVGKRMFVVQQREKDLEEAGLRVQEKLIKNKELVAKLQSLSQS
jgi:hypothetical protein